MTASPLVPARTPRVLFAYRDDVDLRGGAAGVMNETVTALRALGVEAEITVERDPDVTGFDVVHPINIWDPASALVQLRNLHATGAPIAWQPFYLHWSEFAWANIAVRVLGDPSRDERERTELLAAMRDGTLAINGMTRWAPNEAVPGLHAVIAEMAGLVDHVCACSVREMQTLSQTAGLHATPFTITRHGVEAGVFAGADPAPFRELVGDGDFVLCVGSIDVRKNQILLARALRDTEHDLVLVGPCYEPDTLRLVKELGGPRVRHFDRLPRELVASAVNAAAAHVLPSFAEGSALASMEAAAAGCPVVVSNRSSEFEYYGDHAIYCDPVDPDSIRRAVDEAVRRRREEPARLEALGAHISAFTWEDCARATLGAYERAIAAGRRRARRACELGETRGTVVLAFADELSADPSLLAAYAARVGPGDDATLVIATPPGGEDALVAAVAAAGLDGPGSPDLLAAADVPLLGRAADAALTRRPRTGPLAHLDAIDVAQTVAAAA